MCAVATRQALYNGGSRCAGEPARQGDMAHQGSYEGGQQRLRVLLVGHICAPELGSEPGFIWNWAWHLSEQHDVWVIAHPRCRAAVETAMAPHRDRALRFVWVELSKRWDPWDPARG